MHPLVLLSVVDHYNRVAKDSKRRVVGVLLGESYHGRVDVTNSFAGLNRLHRLFLRPRLSWVPSSMESPAPAPRPASLTVPFEEDPRDPTVWFLDSDHLEAMFLMFKKVNGAARVPVFSPHHDPRSCGRLHALRCP